MATENQTAAEATSTRPRKTRAAGRKRAAKRRGARRGGRAPLEQARAMMPDYGRTAAGLANTGKRLMDDAYGWMDEARHAVPRLTKGLHLPSTRSIEGFVESNPVLLGAVGLGIGMIIGALLPRDAFHNGSRGLGMSGVRGSPRSARRSKKPRAKR